MPTSGRLYKFIDGSVIQVLYIAKDTNDNNELKIVYRFSKNIDKVYICNLETWKSKISYKNKKEDIPWLITDL